MWGPHRSYRVGNRCCSTTLDDNDPTRWQRPLATHVSSTSVGFTGYIACKSLHRKKSIVLPLINPNISFSQQSHSDSNDGGRLWSSAKRISGASNTRGPESPTWSHHHAGKEPTGHHWSLWCLPDEESAVSCQWRFKVLEMSALCESKQRMCTTLYCWCRHVAMYVATEAYNLTGLHYPQQDTPPEKNRHKGEGAWTTGCGDELPPRAWEE